MAVNKAKAEIATIDCTLVTIETEDGEFGFDTANQIAVEPQIETTDAVKLIVKGILRAQKPEQNTITGNRITLSDNLFNPELVLVLQGGQIKYDPVETSKIIGYTPPLAGSAERGQVFKLNAYSAQYDAAGLIVQYEKITYPNCQGVPVAFGSEDGAFRAPEYTINSAPKNDEAPYEINYVDKLPELVAPPEKQAINITVVPDQTVEYEEGVTTSFDAATMFTVTEATTGQKFYSIVEGETFGTIGEDGHTINLTGQAGTIKVGIAVAEDDTYLSGRAENDLIVTLKV